MRASILLLIFFLPFQLFARDENPKDAVNRLTNTFLRSLISHDLKTAAGLLADKEINWFGKVWVKKEGSEAFLGKYVGNGLTRYNKTQTYSFDDCVSDGRGRAFALKAYRVFDSNSILSVSVCNEWSDNKQADSAICLVFQRIKRDWKIVSISSAPWFKLVIADHDSATLAGFNKHTLDGHHLVISIPPSFELKTTTFNQIDFVQSKNSVRIATYNINSRSLDFDSAPNDLPDPLLTFAERLFDDSVAPMGSVSNRILKFFPNGYWIECIIVDGQGKKNKSISLVLRVPASNVVVWVQFFAFEAAYDSIWRDIDLSLRSVQLVK